jgi:muconolactone delta-isomerase
MANQGDDDLQASTTEGFKVGEKKTVEEYAKLGKWDNWGRNQLQYMVYRIAFISLYQESHPVVACLPSYIT